MLKAFDFDDQPISPLFNHSVGPTMEAYISQIPGNGTGKLYFLNGSEITMNHAIDFGKIRIPFDISSSTYAVRFRPPLDEFSMK